MYPGELFSSLFKAFDDRNQSNPSIDAFFHNSNGLSVSINALYPQNILSGGIGKVFMAFSVFSCFEDNFDFYWIDEIWLEQGISRMRSKLFRSYSLDL